MPHMLTQGKPVVQGQATTFPGYATIPTSGNNQTLVISQLGVLGQNILPATLQQQGKPQEIQKVIETKDSQTLVRQILMGSRLLSDDNEG